MQSSYCVINFILCDASTYETEIYSVSSFFFFFFCTTLDTHTKWRRRRRQGLKINDGRMRRLTFGIAVSEAAQQTHTLVAGLHGNIFSSPSSLFCAVTWINKRQKKRKKRRTSCVCRVCLHDAPYYYSVYSLRSSNNKHYVYSFLPWSSFLLYASATTNSKSSRHNLIS